MTVSREMNKRGFNTSKSADARTNDSNGDCPDDPVAPSLSPPQVFGQRTKLTDLNIDFNFVPKKNKMKKSTGSNLPSPDGKTQPRIRASTNGTSQK